MNDEVNTNDDAADEAFATVDNLVGQLKAEAAENRDRALRAQAELDNVRKRMQREMDDERKYANVPLLRDLLPVIDNVGRAIEAAQKSADAAAIVEGFKMVQQQLEATLGRHDCRKIDALHKPFDPHLHMAILQQPSADHKPGTVIMVTQEGYQLHDRVLRPSQVIVAAEAKAKAES